MALLLATATAPSDVRLVVVQICLLAVMASGAFRVRSPIAAARVHGFRSIGPRCLCSPACPTRKTSSWRWANNLKQLRAEIKYFEPASAVGVFQRCLSAIGHALNSDVSSGCSGDECRGALESTTSLGGLRSTRSRNQRAGPGTTRHQRPPVLVIATVNGVITGLAAVGEERPAMRNGQSLRENRLGGICRICSRRAASNPSEALRRAW